MTLTEVQEPLPGPKSSITNLPTPMTSFVGRAREAADVKRMLSGARLLTITGTGGAGKTRLALKVASELLPEYPGGVWFVDLATLADPTLLPASVAAALGVREEPGRDLMSTLLDFIQPLKMLILLDNCEHMVRQCAALADTLLRACPALQILATSLMPLGIEYEVAWRVPSLSMPDSAWLPPLEVLPRYEAVRLFVERARLRRPDFDLTPNNAASVVQLCHSLDGLPLAIELAAARVRVLSVEQIVARLDERFRLLTSGTPAPTGAHRQQALTTLMDWSYDLLAEPEKSLLRGLSVFAGSFALEAVIALWSADLDEFEVIDLLTRLVDKSLVVVEERRGDARYRLLETIRQYAAGKLTASGEARDLQRRHRDWYMGLAEASQSELLSPRQGEWLERLEWEHDNLRAAIAWSLKSDPNSTAALRTTGALVWFWYFRGYLTEGRNYLAAALALPGSQQRIQDRAKGLNAAGALAYLQSDYAPARAQLEDALSVGREVGDRRNTAFSLSFLGQVLTRQGDPSGEELCAQGMELFREIGDTWGLALALDFLGEMAWARGDDARAMDLHDESLALYRELGDKWGIALEISNFGRVALRRGDYEQARARLEEALVLQREVGDQWSVAWTLHNLGDAARCSGDIGSAGTLYQESMDLFEKLGEKWGFASSLHMMGHMARHGGDFRHAEELFDDSLAFFRQLGDKRLIAHTLYSMGEAVRRQGDTIRASALFAESLALIRELGDHWGESFQFNWLGVIAQQRSVYETAPAYGNDGLALCGGLGDRVVIAACLEWFGMVAVRHGNFERGGKLFGAASALREKLGAPLESEELVEYDRHLVLSVQGAGKEQFERYLGAGRAMSSDAAVELALSPETAPAKGAPGAPQLPEQESEYPDDLTRREVEVLRLVASGMTDTQIAEQLTLSIRTVQAHIRSIYTKLDVNNRSGATRYAMDRGLV